MSNVWAPLRSIPNPRTLYEFLGVTRPNLWFMKPRSSAEEQQVFVAIHLDWVVFGGFICDFPSRFVKTYIEILIVNTNRLGFLDAKEELLLLLWSCLRQVQTLNFLRSALDRLIMVKVGSRTKPPTLLIRLSRKEICCLTFVGKPFDLGH